MQQTIINTISSFYNSIPKSITSLGGGFYGRVFLVSLNCEPYLVVAKLFLFPNIAKKEAEQIAELAKYATLKMPQIYYVCEATISGFDYDVILMEYLNGANAAYVDALQLKNKAQICDDIINNLIAYHNATNEKGFGELTAQTHYKTWQEYYYPIAQNIVFKAEKLFEKGQLTTEILSVFQNALLNFDRIFYIPIAKPSLVHGDYNTWNIMLDVTCSKAYAAIDPFNCCWADPEIDLYQLDNANGKGYGLLKRYVEKMPLSENFEQKRRFYELFSEVSHYHDAGVPVDIDAVKVLAKRLNDTI